MLESCLSEEERALLPLMAWAHPVLQAAQAKVLALLQALATQYPERLAASSLASSVEAALVRPLIAWSQRTIILELGIARHYQQLDGDTPEARFADFVAWIGSDAGRKRLSQNYPALQHDIRLRCRQSAKFVSSLLRQLVRDWPRLATLCDGHPPGPLQRFTTLMGQAMLDGKSVTRLDFAAGNSASTLTLYYKPHSMALDQAYQDLLAWLAQQGVAPLQRSAAVLDCGTYGYMAQVAHQPCDNVEALQRYYQRFGGLVALTYALGSMDLHQNNLIAAGEWPILINLETLLQPALFGPEQRHGLRAPFADSILFSGLLPRGTLEGEHVDHSALFIANEALVTRIPVDAGTDQMKLKLQRVAQPQCANMASIGQQLVHPLEFASAISQGFSQTYRDLLRHKKALLANDGPLTRLCKLPLRAIMRPVQVYNYALLALTHPNYLDSMDQRERLVARLRPATVSGRAARKVQLRRTPILRCWPAERLALQRGDVPYFTASVDSLNAQDEQGEALEKLFARSALQEAQARIKQLSPADLQRQLRLLQQALESMRPQAAAAPEGGPGDAGENTVSALATPAKLFVPGAAQQAALRIGQHILAQAMGGSGFACYYQLEARGHKVVRPFALRPELGDGLAGLALFFAELVCSDPAASQSSRFLRETERIVASVQRSYLEFQLLPDSCGAFSGLPGWVHTLALLSQRLHKPQWLTLACDWLPKLQTLIAQDRHFDALQGCAGAVLVMLHLEPLAPGCGALAIAQTCVAHLQQHVIWDSVDDGGGARWHDGKVDGFAQAGIVLALAQYAEACADNSLDDLIGAALRPLCQAAADESADDIDCSWQHGAAGRGLTLLNLPARWQNDATRAAVLACVSDTLAHGFDAAQTSHCAAYGQIGSLELLMQAANPHWQTLAAQLLEQGQQQWRCASAGHDLFGYLSGLAGIGHGLLRLSDPLNVPALLTLQA